MTPKWLRSRREARRDVLEDVRAVHVGPDDVLVFQVDRHLDASQAQHIKNVVAKVLSNPCLVVTDGMKLSVLAREAS